MSKVDTLTVYFCGSGNHRGQTDKFLIPFFFSQTIGKVENLFDPGNSVIFDGPGGKYFMPRFHSKNVRKHVAAGNFNKALRVSATHKKPSAGRIRAPLIDGISGAGATSNVLAAWAWLARRCSEDNAFTTINLVGFSRGAYSCFILAQILQQDEQVNDGNREVNMFTFDPVPGGHDTIVPAFNDAFHRSGFGTSLNSAFSIKNPEELPSIVKNYRSIVQANISKRMFGVMGGYAGKDYIFKSVVPKWAPGSTHAGRSMKVFIMPGRHSASAELSPRFAHSSAVGRHLCATFLKANGTEMAMDLSLSPSDLNDSLTHIEDEMNTAGASKAGYNTDASKHRGQLVERIRAVSREDALVSLIEFKDIGTHLAALRTQQGPEYDRGDLIRLNADAQRAAQQQVTAA